ncbi:hypothetical protein Agub_g708 [Astrephomene gubernaculifera]|uniref:Nucleotide-diphospho-sugar transferase domain-containing protein n=1 Tax=Astrephomene gubernaculifera TaxID=47775 RepID=A0AAD3DGV3_9CHLO|nr:hypothetical protein Agub_g708 [Astrephomene gubernaculifera]
MQLFVAIILALCSIEFSSIRLLANAGRICERGGYCSVGKLDGYTGPLDTAAQLQEALKATAFRNEVIIFAESRMNEAAQALHRFHSAGYGHVLVVMDEPVQCQQLRAVLRPWQAEEGPVSCGTYAIKSPSGTAYQSGFEYLQHPVHPMTGWRKYHTVGRAVALGYNVMAVDTDILILDDWYWRAKQPPLRQYNMLCQNEVGIAFNSGFCYIQNATSNGPITWLLFEATHRVARWTEDDSVLQNTSSHFRQSRILRINDQSVLQETVHSAVLGRPIFSTLLATYGDDEEAYKKHGTTRFDMWKVIEDAVRGTWEEYTTIPIGGEIAKATCEFYEEPTCNTSVAGAVLMSSVNLKVPHSGGQWPLEFGGYPFSRTIGPKTAAYRRSYAELGVSLPPDPEDPATEAAARAIKPERFGYLAAHRKEDNCLGCWAQSTWSAVGRHGWWHTRLYDTAPAPRKVAMGHVWVALFPGDFGKDIALMLAGHYDFRVAARAAKGRRYLTNQLLPHGLSHYTLPEARVVVAFQPGVIHAGMSKEQFIKAAQGLAQVAVTLGAIAAWPTVPCDSD